MKRKIAVLSNVNMNFVLRMLKREFSVYDAEGYGNELGTLFNRDSAYYEFDPEITFFIMDLLELLGHEVTEESEDYAKLDRWVQQLESLLEKKRIYYISDGFLWGPETEGILSPVRKAKAEYYFLNLLSELQRRHENVRIFPYRQLIENLGTAASFSLKTWYMGKILHSGEAQKRIGEEIRRLTLLEYRIPRKVLILDLDNTLWGGLAGENDHTPVLLSEDHEGLAYKNEQRLIRQMREKGVLLAIVSKNNEEDAMEIIRDHPHMVLREKDFAARRINWKPKHENILEIAKELNLGTDSFVFWDDNPQERELIRHMLPEVAVGEFPETCEELTGAVSRLYREYFEKTVVTEEDRKKTKQYEQNARRTSLEQSASSFGEYLQQLQIVAERVEPAENITRMHQLINKTNQFNLTTKRYELSELQDIVENFAKRVYLYKVRDCFGDYGIVAVIIVDMTGDVPEVEEFAMSCRIMGKNVEYALLQDVERDLYNTGFEELLGRYIPTAKNKPVEKLYEKLGYVPVGRNGVQPGEVYRIHLEDCPEREHYVTFR